MMNEQEYNKAVAANLRRIMYERDKTQADMARDLGIKKGTISTWMNGKHMPRMDKIDMMCKYLNCKRSDLLEVDKERKTTKISEEQAQLIQLTMQASADNVRLVLEMLKRLEGLQ